MNEKLTALKGGPPSDDQLIEAVGWGVSEDETFISQVVSQGGTALTNEEEWDKIISAGAGAVLQEYVTAIDKKEWP